MRHAIDPGPMAVEDITPDVLLDKVTNLKYKEWRLMQICATKVGEDRYEILYTFGHGYKMFSYRLTVSDEDKINSITSIYDIAYLYENEMHDMFGIQVEMINIDFKGHLFRMGKETPFK